MAVVRALLKQHYFQRSQLSQTSFYRGAERINHVLSIVTVEELGVCDHSTGIVNKGDEEGFTPLAVRLLDGRAVHRIGLPELIGKLHREGTA